MYTLTYIYIHLYTKLSNPCCKVMLLLLNIIECKTLRSIYSISLVFHDACFE